MPQPVGRAAYPAPQYGDRPDGPAAFLALINRMNVLADGGPAAQRDVAWGIPTTPEEGLLLQGAEWYRTDMGWTERFYAPFNATTNPGGARGVGAAGQWLPVSGALPHFETGVIPFTTEQRLSASTVTIKNQMNATAATWFQRGGFTRQATSIAVPFPGIYSASAQVLVGSTTGATGVRRFAEILFNGMQAARDQRPFLANASATFPQAELNPATDGDYATAGALVQIQAFQDSGSPAGTGLPEFRLNSLTINYKGPA